jgi:hypothetical protein
MHDLTLSNSLADLAARINAEHEAAGGALKRSLQHAIAAGELLLEAKDQLKHGQWLPWLKGHCQISERTVRLYMRVAKNTAQIGNVADLTVRGAVALLASPLDSLTAVATAMAAESSLGLTIDEAEWFSDEIAKRFSAYRDTIAALENCIELDAPWGPLGVQLKACQLRSHALMDDMERDPLVLEKWTELTTAAFDARDIALEMLRLARNGEVVAP